MTSLQSIFDTIATADEGRDFEGLRQARQALLDHHGESDAAAEAAYKVGLDLLFRHKDLDGAVSYLERAARAKHPYWSAAARTSLGLCYYHQRRPQRALFELRRVGYAKQATGNTVTALTFLETIFANMGQQDQAERVRQDRIAQLEQLIDDGQRDQAPPQDLGTYLYQLGVACKDSGEPKRAEEAWRRAAALGLADLGQDLYRAVMEALKV